MTIRSKGGYGQKCQMAPENTKCWQGSKYK